jgi:uncharacterized protein
MRVAATADLHFSAQRANVLKEQLAPVREEADLLIVAGDLTNYGQPNEMEPLVNVLVRLRVPIVAVLGNHDYESGKETELIRMMGAEGIKVLDGTGYERDGVGFAGTKGFVGGFGRGVLTAFGEPEIKTFVRASIDETMKLERAMSQLRTERRVVVLHYAPIVTTVVGEAPEIYPYLQDNRRNSCPQRGDYAPAEPTTSVRLSGVRCLEREKKWCTSVHSQAIDSGCHLSANLVPYSN